MSAIPLSKGGGSAPSVPARGLPEFAELVVELVDTIPAGMVLSYGDVAELLERGGPRQVGQVMAHYGSLTCWWRVVLADGSLPPGHVPAAHSRHVAEGTPRRGGRIDMSRARWAGPAESVSAVADPVVVWPRIRRPTR
ncbi:MAG: MGMT family protein [Actinomycetota bacterium]|nr:MGMT family protein [Actinomycetota bacterium]